MVRSSSDMMVPDTTLMPLARSGLRQRIFTLTQSPIFGQTVIDDLPLPWH